MGWRFRRRVRVMPGLYLNLGRRGASVSLGVRGAHVTFGRHGKRATIGLPGSGISYTVYEPRHSPPVGAPEPGGCGTEPSAARQRPSLAAFLLALFFFLGLIVVVALLGR
jgi:hypothetical protein